MKNSFLITVLTVFFCPQFSYGQLDDIQMFDIRTPMGNTVVSWITEELSFSWRQWEDIFWSTLYPNAEMIIVYDGLSSTRKFNCHGYAWLRVEHGIDRWIGLRGNEIGLYPDIYMNDNS